MNKVKKIFAGILDFTNFSLHKLGLRSIKSVTSMDVARAVYLNLNYFAAIITINIR